MAVGKNSLWKDAFKRLKRDRVALVSLSIVIIYSLMALLSSLGIIAQDWSANLGGSYESPNASFLFGTDLFGRSVGMKLIKGTEVAMSVGLIVGIVAVTIGVVLGLISGYFGGKIDEVIVWFYTTLSSIPSIMFLVSMTYILGKGIFAVYMALGLAYWVNICRLIRGEVIRHKNREYVQAASSIGAGHTRKIFGHILPNVVHIVIIQFSLIFQAAIKSEVILSYLGLGVQGRPSWGIMIDDAKLELARGVWWQLAGASLFMFVIVLAFNLLGDSLRDSLDPKLRGKA